jgi:hypothetical protein
MILRLDFDRCPQGPPLTIGRATYLLRRAGVRPVWLAQRRSPGGNGWHVELAVRPAPRTAMEAVALQAVLGSDRGRESCNVQRARMVDAKRVPVYWRRRFNVLYGKES